MAARSKQPAPGEWSYAVGEVPHQMTAFERAERGMAIYTRVWNGKRYGAKKRLCGPIRDERGRIIPEREIEAQQATLQRHAARLAGLPEEERSTRPLTLGRGFRLILKPKEGKFAADSRWKGDMERHSKLIMAVLGPDMLWEHLRHKHYRTLWRHMAEQHRDHALYGMRAAEVMVAVLQAAVRWLQVEGHMEPGTGIPAPKWQEALRKEWAEITGRPVGKPKKPRHSVSEQRKLWAALPKADPRLELAVEIGAELRLGQIPRSRRTDVQPHRGFRIGAVQVHGKGKKHGELVVLTMRQRHVLTRALTSGYLADLERAYQGGEIEDYFLITGGRLRTVKDRRGRKVRRAQLRHAGDAWGETGLGDAWRALERLADVKRVAGRRWYGLRRLHSDLAEDIEDDARVLNRLGAWQHTSTREGYQEQGRTDIADRAATAREKLRPNPRQAKQDNDLQAGENSTK